MKKFLLLACFIAVSAAYSQTTTKLNVSESEQYKDEVKAKDILAIHTTNSGVTGIVRDSKRDFLFDVFDTDLNKIFTKVVDSERNEVFVGEVFSGDELKFFTVDSPKKTERIIYCHIFNLAQKSVKKVKLFETSIEKKQALFSGGNKRETSFAISPSGNYFAVTTDNTKKHSNAYTIRVFDASNLNLLFEKVYQEHEDRFYEHNDLSIDDEANVYALGKLFVKGRSQKKGGEANYDFVLSKISKSDMQAITIGMEEEHIQSLNISMIENQLHLLGFYSEERAGRIKGGCNFTVDKKELAITSKKYEDLPLAVYEDLYGDKRADRKKDKELTSFYVDYVLTDDDENTYMLAEEFYITTTYVSMGMNGGHVQTIFHFDDILVFKFDNKGNLAWGRSIFKRATSPSYNAFVKNNQLHVILNSGKNLLEKNDGRTKVSKGFLESSSLYDIVYAIDGEVSYDKIQDNKGNTDYVPFFGTFENGTFIMSSAGGGRKNQFMILK